MRAKQFLSDPGRSETPSSIRGRLKENKDRPPFISLSCESVRRRNKIKSHNRKARNSICKSAEKYVPAADRGIIGSPRRSGHNSITPSRVEPYRSYDRTSRGAHPSLELRAFVELRAPLSNQTKKLIILSFTSMEIRAFGIKRGFIGLIVSACL